MCGEAEDRGGEAEGRGGEAGVIWAENWKDAVRMK